MSCRIQQYDLAMLSVLLFRIYTVIGASLVLLFNDYLGLIGKYQWWGLQIIGVRSILLHIIHLPTFTYLGSYLPSAASPIVVAARSNSQCPAHCRVSVPSLLAPYLL